MDVKILGPGCANCRRLEAITRDALHEIGLHATVEKVEDLDRIVGYGVFRTPGLVIDGRVVVSGRVPTPQEVATLLASAASADSTV